MKFALGVIQKTSPNPLKITIKDSQQMPKQSHIPANAPPPFEFPRHLLNMDVVTDKKPQTVIQKDAGEITTFDMIEDKRVTFPQRVRQGDSAPVAPQKLKTTSKHVKISDLNAELVVQQYQPDRKIANMKATDLLMARGYGVVVPDDKDLAQRRNEFKRSDHIGTDPNQIVPCTNNQFAPLTAADLLGEMKVINYPG